MSEALQGLGAVGPGSMVAGYRVESQLGVGGMAVVFRAKDERLNRMVALKLMAPQWAQDPQFRLRFLAESRAAAAVDDPHVIPVYEAGEADGLLFIAMRLVNGPDLRGVIHREGPMPPTRTLELLSPVASALDSAHAARLIHRDVKPANVLVHERPGRPGHVYLSDFGLSKGSATGAASLTGTGQYLGTPNYSSPEQCRGRPVDGRTDQYALACIAYEMLTGHVPFERDDGLAVLLAHITEPPPSLTKWRRDLPPAADPVIAKALAKSPSDRYPTCQDFTDALHGALGSERSFNGARVAHTPPVADLQSATGNDQPDQSHVPRSPGRILSHTRWSVGLMLVGAVVAAVLGVYQTKHFPAFTAGGSTFLEIVLILIHPAIWVLMARRTLMRPGRVTRVVSRVLFLFWSLLSCIVLVNAVGAYKDDPSFIGSLVLILVLWGVGLSSIVIQLLNPKSSA